MLLSEHLTYKEATFTTKAPLDNNPPASSLINMVHFAIECFEPMRSLLGVPLHIDSMYRSMEVNQAIGGAKTSDHMIGCAVDFFPMGRDSLECMDILVVAVKEGRLIAHQLIYYPKSNSRFMHISYRWDSSLGPNKQEIKWSAAPRGSGGPYHDWSTFSR